MKKAFFGGRVLKTPPALIGLSTQRMMGIINTTISRVLSRIFCLGGGGEVDPKKIFWSHAAVEKIFLILLGGPEACCSGKVRSG